MKRVYGWLFILGLTISAIGCGGSSSDNVMPENTGATATEEPDMSGKDLQTPDLGAPPP